MTAMGEPGTKQPLSLAELEASAGLRTGRKHILSILVENKPGVLTRIAGHRLQDKNTLVEDLRAIMQADGPAFVDVRVTKEENTFPMIAPGAAARDMVG